VSDDFPNPRLAERLARAARAAQALSETLWEALHEELIDPRGQRVAELSERLADVSATVALLARVDAGASSTPELPIAPAQEPESRSAGADSGFARAESRSAEAESGSARAEPGSARVVYEESPAPRESPVAEVPPSAAMLVDELAAEESPPGPARAAEIEIRDERGEHAPTAWIASIERRLERYERDGVPFAVLLVELADVERLRHAELPGEVSRLTGLVETALTSELRPADSLTRESPGRYWLLAAETDTGSAGALAERLAGAVRRAASHRGAPLEVAVGIAVCPANGSQAVALAGHADIALYAARAAGRPVAP
jgi:GGDEF domain-containing protein